MTTFWRNGFWRTSINGVSHWVDGHMVDRYTWDRTGYSHGNGALAYGNLLRDARAARGFTSTFINPNANCPVCGAAVFFYQNVHGSCVFFDELGPPWPKHPCTDNAPSSKATGSTAPPIRSGQESSLVQQWLRFSALDPEQEFVSKYELSPWAAFKTEGRFGGRLSSVVVLRRLLEGKPQRIYLRVKGLPRVVRAGTLVFYYKGWISFFDESKMRPRELEAERLRSASQFIDELITMSEKRHGAT